MYDILIIGSGPAGLSAAIYGKRALLELAVIEKDFEDTVKKSILITEEDIRNQKLLSRLAGKILKPLAPLM